MGRRQRGKVEGWIAGAMIAHAFTMLSCSSSFETQAPQGERPESKGGSEFQLVQTERKLRASGCAFELLPAAKRIADEKLTCGFDFRKQGASAVGDAFTLIGKLDQMTSAIREHVEIAGDSLRADRREQLDHRLLLIADTKGDLKAELSRLYDDEARVRFALAGLGPAGCEIVGTRLVCEEAVDLGQATLQIEALKHAEEAIGILYDAHRPILKTSLDEYDEIASAIGSRRTRLEDGVKVDSTGGAVGIKIPGEGANGIKSAISIDGGLFVSAVQTSHVAKTIDGIAALIAQNGWAKDLRAKAYRRVVLTPLVSAPVDVDFESTSRTVYLPDTIKAEDALEFLRNGSTARDAQAAVRQTEGLEKLASSAKAMKDSGDLGSTGLLMEGSVARKWSGALMAYSKIRKALDLLKDEGVWTTQVKASVRVVAADRFATFGEGEMTIHVNASEAVDVIVRELREALATRDASIARIEAI